MQWTQRFLAQCLKHAFVVGLVFAFSMAQVDGQLLSPGEDELFAASERFELRAEGLAQPSVVALSSDTLAITAPDGTVNSYARLPKYDTADGAFIGYSSRALQQIIRWPSSGSGSMQIGTLQRGKIEFAPSRMKVHRVVSSGGGGPDSSGDGLGGAINPSQLTPFNLGVGSSNRQFLSLTSNDNFRLINSPQDINSTWFINPIGKDLVRLQRQMGREWMALGVTGNSATGNPPTGISPPRVPPGRNEPFRNQPRGSNRNNPPIFPSLPVGSAFPVGLYPIHGGIDLVWHLHLLPGGGYVFESIAYPGMCLTIAANRGLFVQPIVYDPWQIWYPQTPSFVIPIPQYETTDYQFVPNPPLPPIEFGLANSHQDELMVLLMDRRGGNTPRKLRIPAGGTLPVTIDRDAGGTIVETISIADDFGGWIDQQYTTEVPPSVLYDASVYEIFLQSIAIDRTGTSPNPIEDVNFQPRSIGIFLLPPGSALEPGSEIDAYQTALDQQNPGAVRRLTERELKGGVESKVKDPLKDLLNQFQKQRASF